jgi:hypothetical protein
MVKFVGASGGRNVYLWETTHGNCYQSGEDCQMSIWTNGYWGTRQMALSKLNRSFSMHQDCGNPWKPEAVPSVLLLTERHVTKANTPSTKDGGVAHYLACDVIKAFLRDGLCQFVSPCVKLNWQIMTFKSV